MCIYMYLVLVIDLRTEGNFFINFSNKMYYMEDFFVPVLRIFNLLGLIWVGLCFTDWIWTMFLLFLNLNHSKTRSYFSKYYLGKVGHQLYLLKKNSKPITLVHFYKAPSHKRKKNGSDFILHRYYLLEYPLMM